MGEETEVKARTLQPGSPDYPSALYALDEPPALRVLGEYDVEAPCATVVGTRVPTDEGASFAFELGGALARSRVTVVSGGALGIDHAAHLGAVAAQGSTVAFLGCGLGKIQEEHRELFETIVKGGGALVSAFPDRTVARRHNFFLRNELMALVGRCTIVVECGVRSGARNTMKHARQHARPHAAVPHAPWSRGVGTGVELQLGASVVLCPADALRLSGVEVTDARHFRTSPSASPRPVAPASRVKPETKAPTRPKLALPSTLSPLARAIIRMLSRKGPLATEDLAEAVGSHVGELAMELLQLEVEGVLRYGANAYELTTTFDVSMAETDA